MLFLVYVFSPIPDYYFALSIYKDFLILLVKLSLIF